MTHLLYIFIFLKIITNINAYIRPNFNNNRGRIVNTNLDISSQLLEVGNDLEISTSNEMGVEKIVMKFGGSSLATPERIVYVAKLIKKHVDNGYKPIIVCSAMGKTTNALLTAGDFALEGSVSVEALRTLHSNAMNELGVSDSCKEQIHSLLDDMQLLLSGVKYIGELSPRTLDTLVSFGERMSIRIMAATLNNIGVPAQAFDSWKLGLLTTSEFGNADILDSSYDDIFEKLKKVEGFTVPIVTGFIANDVDGKITTLGRGGSDLTATVLGAAWPADEVQVWKDVDGIMTADPRLVKSAQPVNTVTYEEAAELAYFGAEVLHPISMQPAIRTNTPVRVKNSYNPQAIGTRILNNRDKSDTLVTAITSKSQIQLIDIVSTKMLGQHGFLSKVFEIFTGEGVSVDVVATSEVSVSLTLDKSQVNNCDITSLVAKLREIADVRQYEGRAIISLICNTERATEVMAKAFATMQSMGITVEMLSQGASKVNISFVVKMEDKDALIASLHSEFFE